MTSTFDKEWRECSFSRFSQENNKWALSMITYSRLRNLFVVSDRFGRYTCKVWDHQLIPMMLDPHVTSMSIAMMVWMVLHLTLWVCEGCHNRCQWYSMPKTCRLERKIKHVIEIFPELSLSMDRNLQCKRASAHLQISMVARYPLQASQLNQEVKQR